MGIKKSARSAVTRVGSLCDGDLSQIAQVIYRASLHAHVTVWSDVNSDVLFDRADRSPDVEPEYLAGTYGIGSGLSDIQNDLELLQRERVPAAILFEPSLRRTS